MDSYPTLENKELMIVFATSPTGLGHLRVTDALYHGLPDTVPHVLLGAQDPSISNLYRFVSIHPLTRSIMEWLQNGPLEHVFTGVSRIYLRSHVKLLYQQLITILGERLTVPKTLLLIATHTALAHQLGQLKQKLKEETGMNVILVVQVTDDSPQTIWYVEEADTIFVPSEYTKENLLAYAKSMNYPLVPIKVIAYPISPLLTEKLTESEFKKRLRQVQLQQKETIHVCIPVSGAAVGTTHISALVKELHSASDTFMFHIISKEAPYTTHFLNEIKNLPYIKIAISNHDRTTVDNYEQVYKQNIIALEVTKPSEQAFKALATPSQRGGAILLFSHPVGRQEYDNLHFLRNHGMMPSKHTHEKLWQLSEAKQPIRNTELLKEAHNWRALRLPDNPKQAAAFIVWCQSQGLFTKMIHYKRKLETRETSPDGVEQLWITISQLLQTKSLA